MPTSNEELLNSTLRHAIALRALSNREVRELLALLQESDGKIIQLLWTHADELPTRIRSRQYRKLARDIRALRNDVMAEIRKRLTSTLSKLGPVEAEAERQALLLALPSTIRNTVEIALPTRDQILAAALKEPFSGGANSARTLDEWFKQLEAVDQRRILEAVALSVSQGESTERLIQRLRGTRNKSFRDGVLALTRRNAEAMARTAINHVSNQARETVWKENEDIVYGIRWVSTLDGRTSAICRARDGMVDPAEGQRLPKGQKRLTPPGARPPAHPQCRSVTVALLDPDGVFDRLGERPYVASKDKGRARLAADIGRVPATVTYDDWLRSQPSAFQDSVLGRAKGKLFRENNLSLSQFVDRRGHELTIEQLAAL